ncbi:hypothetical protein LXL04_008513 [Taraxacum kok-saghyz]
MGIKRRTREMGRRNYNRSGVGTSAAPSKSSSNIFKEYHVSKIVGPMMDHVASNTPRIYGLYIINYEQVQSDVEKQAAFLLQTINIWSTYSSGEIADVDCTQGSERAFLTYCISFGVLDHIDGTTHPQTSIPLVLFRPMSSCGSMTLYFTFFF